MENYIKTLTFYFDGIKPEEDPEVVIKKLNLIQDISKYFKDKIYLNRVLESYFIHRNNLLFCKEFWAWILSPQWEATIGMNRNALIQNTIVNNSISYQIRKYYERRKVDWLFNFILENTNIKIAETTSYYNIVSLSITTFACLIENSEERKQFVDDKIEYFSNGIVNNDEKIISQLTQPYLDTFKREIILKSGKDDAVEKIKLISTREDIVNAAFNENLPREKRVEILKTSFLQKNLNKYISEITKRLDFNFIDILIEATIDQNNRIKNKEKTKMVLFHKLFCSPSNSRARMEEWKSHCRDEKTKERLTEFINKYKDEVLENFNLMVEYAKNQFDTSDTKDDMCEFFNTFLNNETNEEKKYKSILKVLEEENDYTKAVRNRVFQARLESILKFLLNDKFTDMNFKKKLINEIFKINSFIYAISQYTSEFTECFKKFFNEIKPIFIDRFFINREQLLSEEKPSKPKIQLSSLSDNSGLEKIQDFLSIIFGLEKEQFEELIDGADIVLNFKGSNYAYIQYGERYYDNYYFGTIMTRIAENISSRNILDSELKRHLLFKSLYPFYSSTEAEGNIFEKLTNLITNDKIRERFLNSSERYSYEKINPFTNAAIYKYSNSGLRNKLKIIDFIEYVIKKEHIEVIEKYFPEEKEALELANDLLEKLQILASF